MSPKAHSRKCSNIFDSIFSQKKRDSPWSNVPDEPRLLVTLRARCGCGAQPRQLWAASAFESFLPVCVPLVWWQWTRFFWLGVDVVDGICHRCSVVEHFAPSDLNILQVLRATYSFFCQDHYNSTLAIFAFLFFKPAFRFTLALAHLPFKPSELFALRCFKETDKTTQNNNLTHS